MSTHLTEGELRTWLDGEIPTENQVDVEAHLKDCAICQNALETQKQRSIHITRLMEALSPQNEDFQMDTDRALARLKQLEVRAPISKEDMTMWQKMTKRVYRPVWTVTLIVMLVAGLLAIPQVRAAAVEFLGLFRVNSIEVVQFNPASLPQDLDNRMSGLDSMITAMIETEEEPEPVSVANLEEASQLAGFQARSLEDYYGPREFLFLSGSSAEITLDVPLIRTVLAELGNTELQIPDELQGKKVLIEVPSSVVTILGNCPKEAPRGDDSYQGKDCLSLVQMPSPSVIAPPGLDPQELGTSLLQLLGLSPEEAASFSQRIDWSTTLVIPIPTDVSYRDVKVDGVEGTLMIETNTRSPHFTLLWVKDGILHALTGQGNSSYAVRLANSLK